MLDLDARGVPLIDIAHSIVCHLIVVATHCVYDSVLTCACEVYTV